jgi:hypothetical protein
MDKDNYRQLNLTYLCLGGSETSHENKCGRHWDGELPESHGHYGLMAMAAHLCQLAGEQENNTTQLGQALADGQSSLPAQLQPQRLRWMGRRRLVLMVQEMVRHLQLVGSIPRLGVLLESLEHAGQRYVLGMRSVTQSSPNSSCAIKFCRSP